MTFPILHHAQPLYPSPVAPGVQRRFAEQMITFEDEEVADSLHSEAQIWDIESPAAVSRLSAVQVS